MSTFGHDALGVYKQLADGRVLRVEERMYNCLLTLSPSAGSPTWDEG